MKKMKAVALDYNKEKQEGAPRIVAVGEGYAAEKIVALAREHGVPLVEDIELIGKLVKFPVGSEIPLELYEAVAKILAFIYRLEKKSNE